MLRREVLTGAVLAGMGVMTGAGRAQSPADRHRLPDLLAGDLSPVHDPCMIQDATGLFHVFSTSHLREGKGLIHWRTSPDMVTWTFKGSVMPRLPDWVLKAVPDAKGIWAPDITRIDDRYCLYYSVSTFGQNLSVIGLVTTPTLDSADPAFGWVDQGLVIDSKPGDVYNAIDPSHVIDADGRHWLSFGSFWSGLKLVELDPATGKRLKGARVKSIAARPQHGPIEAPCLFRRGDYYYLTAAYDLCCRGVDSSYYTCIGRASAIEGPYVDSDGRALMKGGGRVLLHADQDVSHRFKGPGGGSVARIGDAFYIVYHAYDARAGGVPTLRIQALDWTADGWPVAAKAL